MIRFIPLLLLFAILAPAQDVTARAQTGDFKMTRVLFFKRKPKFHIPVQYSITYGAPAWRSAFDDQLAAAKGKNVRLRFGKDFWTTLDTNTDLTIGGAKIKAGPYYLVLEHTKGNSINIVALNANDIRDKKLDAFQSGSTTGGIVIPCKHKKSDKETDSLQIKLIAGKEPTTGTLGVRFGPHSLAAAIKVHYGN